MSDYNRMSQEVQKLQFRFKDWVDQPTHADARRITSEIDALSADVRGQKSGPSLEARLKTLIRQLENLEEEVMDFHHSRELAKWCEDMRNMARGL